MTWFVYSLSVLVGLAGTIVYIALTSFSQRMLVAPDLGSLLHRVWNLTDPESKVDLFDGYRSIFRDVLRISLFRVCIALASIAPLAIVLAYDPSVAGNVLFLAVATVVSLLTFGAYWLLRSLVRR